MVCKSCGYINRDGVEFCRHCGIPLKGKPRGAERVRAVKAVEKYYEPYVESAKDPHNTVKPPKARPEEEERLPRSSNRFRAAITAIGIFVIACVIIFCLFSFDILVFPGSGGNISVDSLADPSETPVLEPTAATKPVPTIAQTSVKN